ncbi:cell wall protein IFF6-like [Stylophora pistillata]|uniref:cell wall protein IFF6-like n=1 Tax=Stylophora pistillata TaxID=50429 RepID=UPI000C04851D|nr:cell wall protein IFF6-like [Stylophora pistillata]
MGGGGGDTTAEIRKRRRSAVYSIESNRSISSGKETQIFDRGKVNVTIANNSLKYPDARKYTVLRITVVKHGRNQSDETSKVLSVANDLKQENMLEKGANARDKSLDIMRGANIPLSFQVNGKGSSEKDGSLNDLYGGKPITFDRHSSNESSEHVPLQKGDADLSTQKPDNQQGKTNSKVLLEAKLNPIRIGIQLDGDKNNKEESVTQPSENISLQEVLKDIDDTSRKADPSLDENNGDKENNVLISLNDGKVKDDHLHVRPQNTVKDKENLDKLRIQATSNKENKNGTEVNTAGVSIMTESKGPQTDGLMKVLLTKLLGSDIKDALKQKESEEFKPTSSQKIISSSDMASTTAAGTTVESPPGTIKGVDTAEMNNNAGAVINVEPPAMEQTGPQCLGGGPEPDLLHTTGARVPENLHLPGGRDCSQGIESLPTKNEASSSPTGMVIESAPGTQHAVGTGMPPPAVIAPNPPPLTPSNQRFGSTTPAGVGVESPPGTIHAVGTSLPAEGIDEMGDNGASTGVTGGIGGSTGGGIGGAGGIVGTGGTNLGVGGGNMGGGLGAGAGGMTGGGGGVGAGGMVGGGGAVGAGGIAGGGGIMGGGMVGGGGMTGGGTIGGGGMTGGGMVGGGGMTVGGMVGGGGMTGGGGMVGGGAGGNMGGVGGGIGGGIGGGARGMEVILDLAFLIDGSSAVGNEQNFQQLLKFVSAVSHSFSIHHDMTRVGVVVFSLEAFVIFNFHTYFDIQNIDQALSSVQYPGTDGPGTYIGRGLHVAKQYLFSASGRGHVPRAIVLLAAGRSIDDVITPSMDIRSYGVEMFCVGIGNLYSKLQLHAMASFPHSEHIFRGDYSQMGRTAQQVVTKILKGHQELCDYCPSEFQDDDEVEEGYKRHHHHHHKHDKIQVQLGNDQRRHSKRKRPIAKISGDYEVKQFKLAGPTKDQERHYEQSYRADTFSNRNDDVHPTANPDTDYYGEYKFDDSKMTVEDNDCKDYSDDCNDYASRGFCSEYAPTASIGTINMMCKRACGTCSSNTMRKEKQDTYEVSERDPFYKKDEIEKAKDQKPNHLKHRLNKL